MLRIVCNCEMLTKRKKKSVFVDMIKEVTHIVFSVCIPVTSKTLLKNRKNVVFIVGQVVNFIKSLCQIESP